MKRTLILVPTSSHASDGIIYSESISAGKSGAMLAEDGETIRLVQGAFLGAQMPRALLGMNTLVIGVINFRNKDMIILVFNHLTS